jgi:hypothetical protein
MFLVCQGVLNFPQDLVDGLVLENLEYLLVLVVLQILVNRLFLDYLELPGILMVLQIQMVQKHLYHLAVLEDQVNRWHLRFLENLLVLGDLDCLECQLVPELPLVLEDPVILQDLVLLAVR